MANTKHFAQVENSETKFYSVIARMQAFMFPMQGWHEIWYLTSL